MSSDAIRPTSVQPPSNLAARLDVMQVPDFACFSAIRPTVQPRSCARVRGCERAHTRARAPAGAHTRKVVGRGWTVGRKKEETKGKSTMSQGTLREVMPVTADLVDWLRGQLGKEAADAILLKGKQGKGGFYAAEIGPDGVFREFGSTARGARVVVKGDGTLQWQEPERKRHARVL